MNFTFIVLIILGSILLWGLLATEFSEVGSIISKILKNINNAIHHDDYE